MAKRAVDQVVPNKAYISEFSSVAW